MLLKKNLIANYLGQVWVALMGFGFIPLYVHYLGMEAYGLIGLYVILQASLSLLDMGMPATLNREMARLESTARAVQSTRDLLRSIEIICAGVAVLIFAAGAMLSHGVAGRWLKLESLPLETVQQAITAMSLVIALRFCEGIYRNALLGLQRQVWYNIINGLMITLRSFGAVVVLAWISPSIRLFFYWQALVSLLTLVVFAVSVYRFLPAPPAASAFSVSSLRRVWKFAAGVAATSTLSFLLTQLDKIFLSNLLPLTELGYYTLAGSVAAALGIVVTPISQSFYPQLSELHARNDEAQLASVYHSGAQLVVLSAAPVAAMLVFHTQGIIYLWSSDITLAEKAAPIAALLVSGAFLNSLMLMPWMLQLAYGWSGIAANINMAAVAILVPSLFWVVPHYGTVGAASVWVVLNGAYVVIGIHFMHRRIMREQKWSWYISDVILPVSGVLGITLASLAFQPAYLKGPTIYVLYLFSVWGLSFLAAILMANRIRPRVMHAVRSTFARAALHRF